MQDVINDVLTGLLNQLKLEFTTISVDESDESMIRVDIESPTASRIIGWHGETINALQHLLKAIVRTKNKLDRSPFIVLDVDGYHRAQEEKVCLAAEQKADFVRRKKTRIALPPMSPYFRRIVHLHIASHPDMQDIATESIGEGEYRQVVLRLKEGSMDEGEELVPTMSSEEKTTPDSPSDDGFDNLDI